MHTSFTLHDTAQLAFLSFGALQKIDFLCHGFTLRHYGIGHNTLVPGELRLIAETLGFTSVTVAHQVHGARVEIIGAPRKSYSFEGDGLLTRHPGLAVGVQVADCLPVFLAETKHLAVGMVHAGWKGLAARILPAAVRQLLTVSGGSVKDVTAVIGPAIGPCCYEVKKDVYAKFDGKYRSGNATEGFFLDLKRIAHDQLAAAGIPKSRVFVCNLCTKCREDLFYSYRRREPQGRMLGVVGIKGQKND